MFKLVLLLCLVQVWAKPQTNDNDHIMHPHPRIFQKTDKVNNAEKTAAFWKTNGLNRVQQQLKIIKRENPAKNVILFMGDGMSVPTIAATRNYLGGENVELSFEKFPHTAISKTYCVDYQVPDSACTGTAYLSGVKANMGTVGVTAAVAPDDCHAMTNAAEHTHSIAEWSQQKNKSTGFVTTTRVTHASPSGVYAHTSQRMWECDTDTINSGADPAVCQDIALQLVEGAVGRSLNVIMGGGRYKLLPNGSYGEEHDEGARSDGQNLIDKWKKYKQEEGKKAQYVWNREQLLNLDKDTESVLGVFESDHCKYNLERDLQLDPSLEEMTEAAIKILSKNQNGYFLFVEGGRIDTAHHYAWAHKALDETAEFAKAVAKAVAMTSENDTLIVVTSDHAHTMSFSGYPVRGSDILGYEGWAAEDKLQFTTLNYANGPGYTHEEGGKRHDVSKDDTHDINYPFPAVIPLESETHGGDDVLIFARGPWAHLFSGVMEENVIPYIMGYASCVGEEATACDGDDGGKGNGSGDGVYPTMMCILIVSILRGFF